MPAGKNATVPDGSFALTYDHSTPACDHCCGLPTLRVQTARGTIGFVVAEWPWDMTIPEDPAQHPAAPHYVVEWFAQDQDHHEIPGVRADSPYFIARAIHDRWLTYRATV